MLTRRHLLTTVSRATIAGCTLPACAHDALADAPPIRVGLLHSATGDMAASEQSVAAATMFAIDDVNGLTSADAATTASSEGVGAGVLGRAVVVVRADGRSDPAVFGSEARRLVEEENVSVVFGCWTSSSRKSVAAVLQKAGRVLVYPLQYEGLESASNVLYTGSTPNQQILPALRWGMERFGRSAFLVGSDYVFPRVANAVVREQLAAIGVRPAGETYLPIGADEGELAERVRALRLGKNGRFVHIAPPGWRRTWRPGRIWGRADAARTGFRCSSNSIRTLTDVGNPRF